MSLVDDLAKLEELRRDGALSDAEFAKAKTAILNGVPASSEQELGKHLTDQLAEIKYQNELTQIDRAWEIGRRQFLIRGRYGIEQEPTRGMAFGVALVGLFGVFWTIMAVSMTAWAPDFGPFSVAKVMFPLFGVVFTTAAVGYGIYIYFKTLKYEEAYRAYQALRAECKAASAGQPCAYGDSDHHIKTR